MTERQAGIYLSHIKELDVRRIPLELVLKEGLVEIKIPIIETKPASAVDLPIDIVTTSVRVLERKTRNRKAYPLSSEPYPRPRRTKESYRPRLHKTKT